jgi:hypothetical protein
MNFSFKIALLKLVNKVNQIQKVDYFHNFLSYLHKCIFLHVLLSDLLSANQLLEFHLFHLFSDIFSMSVLQGNILICTSEGIYVFIFMSKDLNLCFNLYCILFLMALSRRSYNLLVIFKALHLFVEKSIYSYLNLTN